MSLRARFTRSPYARRRTSASARAALNRPWLTTDPADALDPHPSPESRAALLVVVDTQAVDGAPGVGIHHYEVACAPDPEHDPGLVLLTRNTSLYDAAKIVEGLGRRVRVTYHPSRRPDGSTCLVLDTLDEVAP